MHTIMSGALLTVKTLLVAVQSVLHSSCGLGLNQSESAMHTIIQ